MTPDFMDCHAAVSREAATEASLAVTISGFKVRVRHRTGYAKLAMTNL